MGDVRRRQKVKPRYPEAMVVVRQGAGSEVLAMGRGIEALWRAGVKATARSAFKAAYVRARRQGPEAEVKCLERWMTVRYRGQDFPRGVSVNTAIFDTRRVREIRKLREKKGLSYRAIAMKYEREDGKSPSPQTIKDICDRKSWGHVS